MQGLASRSVARLSIHVEPHGAAGIARHYIKDLVYGARSGRRGCRLWRRCADSIGRVMSAADKGTFESPLPDFRHRLQA